LFRDRIETLQQNKKKIDWGLAETLAYGSLVLQGKSIRLSGQDVGRGTFSHRHALLVDQETSKRWIPLQHLAQSEGKFEVYNSHLSEYAVLGFEYGFSVAVPDELTIWEAQFGDFANGAQVIIDQFIASAEEKWGRKSSLVMLLPHGYEGQGPEHSSARLERFLALTGDGNIQVVYPTTPAQMFHLLRRQVLSNCHKPLIVFTPKGLLRHAECVSSIDDLDTGQFQSVIDDPTPPTTTDRIAFCTGRIYYDLKEATQKVPVRLIRIEELYPFPKEEIKAVLKQHSDVKEVLWVQEEPSNMGAFWYITQKLTPLLPKGIKLEYVGRSASASPAVGSHHVHHMEHEAILKAFFRG
jgi:2-oxoglutarate dehydrogenase complex, dehydrogenase (E1) component, and related enzymes